jgi:branched-chain amino acid transport system ATP-binding protein
VRDLPPGTARLVELACVLAGDPSVMVLDEPSSGLTLEETDRLGELIGEQARGGFALLVVAHDMRFLMGLAQRVVVLAEGRVVAAGTPDEVRADERVRTLYLGSERA